MKPFSLPAGLCALGLLMTSAGPIEAAWNNVFQVTCHRRGCRSGSAYVAAPVVAAAAPAAGCCDPCPQPVCCTTRYVQRCYYQPITTYTTKTFYEPVTTYRTSYYYEPVTTYRYSCYFDPCTCSYQQVACPVRSYALRAQCCPVQSWVQRCCTVPVQSYQRCCYWEPQTCCTTPTPCCNGNGGAVVQAPAAVVPGVPGVPGPPQTQEQQQFSPPPQTQPPPQGPPGVDERRSGPGASSNQYYGPQGNPGGTSFRQFLPGGPAPARPASPVPSQGVRPDRIASAPQGVVDGQVVRSDRTPRPGAQVLFVNAQRQAPAQAVTANAAGRFQVNLASGGWLVYVSGPDGRQVFHSRIDVRGGQPAPLMVVTR
jgi:hypothetical protein